MMSASKREVDAWMIISLSLSPSSLHVPSPTAFRPWWFVSSSSSFSAGRAGRRPPTNTRPLSPPLVLSVFRVRARVAAAVAAAFGCTWNWERRIVEPLRARCVSPLPPSAGSSLMITPTEAAYHTAAQSRAVQFFYSSPFGARTPPFVTMWKDLVLIESNHHSLLLSSAPWFQSR